MRDFLLVTGREIGLAWRQGAATSLTVTFFVIAVTLFPLGIGPEREVLARIAPGVLWVAVLLATLLSLERLFQADVETGALEQMTLGPLPLTRVVLAKCVAHWVTVAWPLILAAPVLAVLMGLTGPAIAVLVAALAIGTPALSLIGAVGAALTVTVRRGGVLLPVLVLPLCVPTLIFGAGAVEALLTAGPVAPNLYLLGAVSVVALVLAPPAAAAALWLALE